MSPSLQRQEEKKKKTKTRDKEKLPKVATLTSATNIASPLTKEKKNVKIVTPGLSEKKNEVTTKEVNQEQEEQHKLAQEQEQRNVHSNSEGKENVTLNDNTNTVHLPDVKQVVESVNAEAIVNTSHHIESYNNIISNNVTTPARKSLLSTSALRPFSSSSRGSSAGSKALKNITNNCLKMINYNAIRQAQGKSKNSNSNKKHNSIMMSEFLSAHNKGVAMFETEWRNGYERLYEWYRVESYTPHVMQIQKLMRELDFVKEDCTQKLKFAQQSVCNMLHGLQGMISEVRKTGLLVSEETQCLSVNAPFNCEIYLPENKTKCLQNTSKEEELLTSQAQAHKVQTNDIADNSNLSNDDDDDDNTDRTDKQSSSDVVIKTKFTDKQENADMWLRVLNMNTSVMNEVRDYNDIMCTETHPRIKYVSEEEINTINRVSKFFSSFVKDDQLYKLTDDEVVALLSLSDTFIVEEGIEHIVNIQRRKRDKEMLRQRHQIKELQCHVQLMTECVMMLLKRLHMHNSQYLHKMSFQQAILDKVATRVKLADNVLDNVKTINANATAFVLNDLHKLSLNLRSRMDHVEQTIVSSLGQLIEASSTGILSNLEECNKQNTGGSSVAQDAEERKENIMRFFCMTMTEMKREQCDIMCDIYDFMTFLWRTQQHCEETLTEETKNEEEEEHAYEPNIEKEDNINERSNKTNKEPTMNKMCLGRLEKETLRHRSLPTYYTDILEQWCDRDMLLRLLHHMTLHNNNSTQILLSALDEYVHFLSESTHHAEAEAVLERQRQFHEVHRLLIKLHEEGMIDDRSARKHTCSPSYSLADKINDMVQQYNNINNRKNNSGDSFVSHMESKRLGNTEVCEKNSKEHEESFFAFTHPLPAEVRAEMETRPHHVKCPFNEAFYSRSSLLYDDARIDNSKNNESYCFKLENRSIRTNVEHLPNRSAVITYLQQSCASDEFDSKNGVCSHANNGSISNNTSTKFYTSVVGDGRWGGMAAIKNNNNNTHNRFLRRHEEQEIETTSSKQEPLSQLRYGRVLTDALQAESNLHSNIDPSVTSNNNNNNNNNSDKIEESTTEVKGTNRVVPAAPTRVNLINRVVKRCTTNINVSDSGNNNKCNISDDTTNKEKGTWLHNSSCAADSNRCCSEADLWFINRQRALAVPFLVRPHDSDSGDENDDDKSAYDGKGQT